MKLVRFKKKGRTREQRLSSFCPVILGKKDSAPAEYEVKIGHGVAVKA
jgi:hypothetical protein